MNTLLLLMFVIFGAIGYLFISRDTRLSPLSQEVLVAIDHLGGMAHIYSIFCEVKSNKAFSAEYFHIVLEHLERDKLIQSIYIQPTPGLPGRYYQLTDAGKQRVRVMEYADIC